MVTLAAIVARDPAELTSAELDFLRERQLGALATLRADGSAHVVAIAFGYLPETATALVITSDRTQKVINLERDPRAALTQVDGRRWLSLEGRAVVSRDPDRVSLAVAAFEARYRPASVNPNRVAIELEVTRVLGRA